MWKKLLFRLGIVTVAAALVLLSYATACGAQVASKPQPKTKGGRPPLVEAVSHRDVAAVRALLARGANVNVRTPDGSTALFWAADSGDLTMVDVLLRAGADVNAVSRYGVRALPLACENGNPLVIERLLKAGTDPNAPLIGGQTPLMTAARTGNAAAVKVLLAHGAAANAVEDTRGQTALMWAASEGHASVVEELLAAGADISAKSRGPRVVGPKRDDIGAYGFGGKTKNYDTKAPPGVQGQGYRIDSFTPILFAAQFGHLDVARVLVDHGASVNDKAPDGTSALVMAIANGHLDVASYLLDKGADPNAAGQGWNALVQVVRTLSPSVGQAPPVPISRAKGMELAQKLLDHGVEINAPITKQIRDRYRTHLDMVGGTAYLMAAKAADHEMMRLLLKLGADPSLETVAHRTALMVATGIDMWSIDEDSGTTEDAVEAVKVALEAGADVNVVDDDGDTALHGAAFRGSNEMVQMLVDRGAKLDVRDKLGFTPLMIANGDERISCNLQRRPETVVLLTKLMTDRGLPTAVRSDEEKFANGVSTGYSASPKPANPDCQK